MIVPLFAALGIDGVPERSPYRIVGNVNVELPLWLALYDPVELAPSPAVLIVSDPLPGLGIADPSAN